MAVYSYSRLSAFENCPLQYKYNYIDKIERDEEGIEAFMGSRFHEVMEKLYRDLKCRIYTLEELLQYYNEIWEKKYTDDVIIVKKDRTTEDYKNIGKQSIEDYYKRYYPFDQGRVLGIERPVSLDIMGDGKYKLRGFIDRLVQSDDDTYEIHDYKTSGHLPDQAYFDRDRQLALYQIGISDMWIDVDKVKLIWHYVVFDKEMASTRTQEQLDELKQSTIELIDTIESTKDFRPKESFLCNWCSYQDICPTKKHIFAVSDLPVNEYKKDPGVKLVEKFAKFDNKKKDLKKQIAAIEDEQAKIKEAAVEFAEKEHVSVIDGPDARLKVDIKEELKAPSKTQDSTAWWNLRNFLIEEGRFMDVSTVTSSMVTHQMKSPDWSDEFKKKVAPFLRQEITKNVRLVKKRED